MNKRTACAGALLFTFAAVVASSCSDPGLDDLFPTSSSTGTGGSGGQGAAGGSGGQGGEGGVLFTCEDCGGNTPVCVDGEHCAASCPRGREACDTAGDAGPTVCCDFGGQCCAGAGPAGADVCTPSGQACPVLCPGSDVACPPDQYCVLDHDAGTYSCSSDCASNSICGGNLCCPLGTACVNDACPLPDLAVDNPQLQSSAEVVTRTFAADACEIFEGCIVGPGERTLLRFDLKTPNIGEGNLHLGNPQGNPIFEYSQCHGHHHFNGYANYRLLDANGQEVGAGHKQAFCLLDLEQVDPNAPSDGMYSCGYQGIQAGWADVYGRHLPCQWVDVTGVPPGDYVLTVEVNRDHTLAESDYSNNTGAVPVKIPAQSCPNGCRAPSDACCQPGDPCGWGADGSCDCGGYFGWDTADCSSCQSADPDCDSDNTCPGGCTPNAGVFCTDANLGNLQNNGVCDCAGAFNWDANDCVSCNTQDADCPVNSCPQGCTPYDPNRNCCTVGNDVCGWADDGWCDCGGAAWDAVDCASCLSNEPDCP